jgi:hypothetical protein
MRIRRAITALSSTIDRFCLVAGRGPHTVVSGGGARSNDVPASMPEGSWQLGLFKRHFLDKVSQGHISDVKLRCAKGFVRFAFDPELQYNVARKYGSCSMEFEGDQGSQFVLTQF